MSNAATVETVRPADDMSKRVKADPRQMSGWTQVNNETRVLYAPEGAQQGDVCYEAFFSKVVDQYPFHKFDEIEVRAFDESWYMTLKVFEVTSHGLEVEILRSKGVKTKHEQDDNDGKFTIKREGGRFPFNIYRNPDDRNPNGMKMPGSYANKAAAMIARSKLHSKGA